MKNQGIITASKLLWSISNKKEKTEFIFLVFACFIRAITELLPPLATACVVAKLSGEETSFLFIKFPQSISTIWLIVIVFSLFFLISLIGSSIRALVKLFACRMMNKTNLYALEQTLALRKNFQLNMTNGEASYIIKNACEQVSKFIEEFLVRFLSPVISSLIAIIYIATINFYSFLIVGATIILISCSVWFRIYNDKKAFKKFEIINGKLNNHVLNNIDNLPFVGFFKTKLTELEISVELNKQYYKAEKKRINTYLIYWIMIYLTEFACTCVVTILVIGTDASDALLASTLIVLIPYLLKIFTSTESFAFVIENCQQQAIKISRLNLLTATDDQLIKEGEKLPSDINIEKIVIKNLEVKIGDFHKNIEYAQFEKGKINCLAGVSGSGKTTLINCLLGLVECENGEIIINDRYKLNSLFFENNRISLSFQGENFFDRSIVENIMYPQKQLNDKAKDLINEFELNCLLEREHLEGNLPFKTSLSGGEKKRISFIRCLVKDAEVYIFDEPTNELDSKNVVKILNKLKSLKGQAVIITISHDKRVLDISENIIYL